MNLNCCTIILSPTLIFNSKTLVLFHAILINSCWAHRIAIEKTREYGRRGYNELLVCPGIKYHALYQSCTYTMVRVNSTMMKMGVHVLCILHVNIRVLHRV